MKIATEIQVMELTGSLTTAAIASGKETQMTTRDGPVKKTSLILTGKIGVLL